MTIGEKIKFLRKERGMTQKQLADASGVCSRLIQRYEYGDGIPNTDTLLKISSGIGVDINEFSECSGKLPYSISHENQNNFVPVGDRIKIIRKEKGYSQQKLADLTGLARITIAQYETNKYQPSEQNLNKIADTLSIPVSCFYEDELPELELSPKLSTDELELLSLFNSLDSTGKLKLLEYVELLQLKYIKEAE